MKIKVELHWGWGHHQQQQQQYQVKAPIQSGIISDLQQHHHYHHRVDHRDHPNSSTAAQADCTSLL